MKTLLRIPIWLSLLVILLHPESRAQTLDPAFAPTTTSVPGNVSCITQQPDGKYVLLGSFKRTTTGTIGRLVRLNADFTFDQSFNSAVASLQGTVYAVRVLPAGKLLLVGSGTLTLAGVSRQDLLQLNADGSPDTAFDAGTAAGNGTGLVVERLASGQLLVGGTFTSYNGVARNKIVRLSATGSIDATFVPAAFAAPVSQLAVQANGKILVGGSFTGSVGLRRLNSDGTTDASFAAPLVRSVSDLAIQPDGTIIVGGNINVTSGFRSSSLARLLPNGSLDADFLTSVTFPFVTYYGQHLLLLQSDGYLVVQTSDQGLRRLTPTGGVDPAFQQPITPRASINGLAPAAGGQLLVAGTGLELPNHRCYAALLNANGSLDTRFAPVLLTSGNIYALAQQADGKILAGGHFDEVNGQPANNLARFAVDGTLDATFAAPLWLDVQQLVVQPDGKIIVAQFYRTSQPSVLRLLATGAVDAGFVAPARINRVSQLVLQPDGRIVALADTVGNGNTLPIRLLVSGKRDPTFAPLLDGNFENAYSAVLQPDGKLVVAGTFGATATESTIRLLPTGQRDPSFVELSIDDAPDATTVIRQPDGKILLVDKLYSRLRRLTANGELDASFNAVLPANLDLFVVCLQPNNRILIGGYPRYLSRLLANGSLDTSFNSPAPNSTITDVRILPAGQLVVSGYFSTFGSQVCEGLVRLVADNVLAIASGQPSIQTAAYPNPAHIALHLALDSNAHPQRVVLLNMLGQAVLTQHSPLANITLDIAAVPPGTYLLQVEYTTGWVTRRILIE